MRLDRTDIGFSIDRFARLCDGRLVNLDAVRRLVPCSTCAAPAGAACVVSKGPNRGNQTRTHATRAHAEQHSGALAHAHSAEAVKWFGLLNRRGVRLSLSWARAWRTVRSSERRAHPTKVVQPDLQLQPGEARHGR